MRRRTGRKIDPDKFRRLVAQRLLNFDELAAAAKVSRRTVGNAAAGGRLNLPTAQAIADALGSDPDTFSSVVSTEFADAS